MQKNLESYLTKIYEDIRKASNCGLFSIEITTKYDGFEFDNLEAKEILESKGYCIYRSHYNNMSGKYVWCISWDKESHVDCEEDHSLDYTR